MRHDLSTEVLEEFSWLTTEMNFSCLIRPYEKSNIIKLVEFKKDSVLITLVCDNRENLLDFKIDVKSPRGDLCITEFLENRLGAIVRAEVNSAKPERIFDYTLPEMSEENFQDQKNGILTKKHIDIHALVSTYSNLIKVAIKSYRFMLLASPQD